MPTRLKIADDRTIFDEPHHQSLELLATKALADGNTIAAFKLADRRCRILPLPEPHSYVLRSEACFQMGAKASAISDLAKALEIAPDDIAANRRMLAWATGAQQKQAARALIGQVRNFNILRQAIQVLQANGEPNVASVTVLETTIEGWAVWQDAAPLKVSISNGADVTSEIFEPDPFHPLGICGHATSFIVRRPKSTNSQSVLVSTAYNVFHTARITGNASAPRAHVNATRPRNACDQRVTVIVPVYGDYGATRLCLDSLLHELKSSHHYHAILVDDATPDSQIAKYLIELESESCVQVLSNARNLGFIGSVNRALGHATQGDIIILNSDTIVPTGFIDRLATAARSASDIGTVTPLSNNGELTSFPIPHSVNPLGSWDDVARIDTIAANCNAGIIVDIPSGIGFCLYITRACLDTVGPLSEVFAPGYLEDADFCLRARELGFRNVCAPSVYVGHAGCKSFGPEKRSLVVRNLTVLERQFPNHRMECATFMAADPLRTARDAIERTAAAIACHPRLLVTGTGAISAIARERAREIGSEAQPVMILEVCYRADGPIVKIINSAGGMPQSLQFDLESSSERESLAHFIKSNAPSGMEFLDPANTPFQLIDLLVGLEIPYDIFIADAGLLGPQNGQLVASAVRSMRPYAIGESGGAPFNTALEVAHCDDRWWQIAKSARCILVPCPQAEAFVASVLPAAALKKITRTYQSLRPEMRKQQRAGACHLGFVPVRSCAYEQRLIRDTARNLGRIRPDISMTVIGAALDDIGLMRSCNVFVTGAVDPEEFAQLVDALGVKCLFISTTQPLFAHPILSVAFASDVPTAYFDWSTGRIRPKKMDLTIDPRAALDDITDVLNNWIPSSRRVKSADVMPLSNIG